MVQLTLLEAAFGGFFIGLFIGVVFGGLMIDPHWSTNANDVYWLRPQKVRRIKGKKDHG